MSVRVMCAAATALALAACGSETPSGPDGSNGDAGPGGKDAAVDPSNTGLPASWEIAVVEGGDANSGHQPVVAKAPDGTIGVAYYRKTAMSTARCMKMGRDLGPLDQWDLMFSESRNGGAFSAPELVVTVSIQNLAGVALAYDEASRPAVAYMGGADGGYRCGGTDMMLSRKMGATWTTTTIDGDGNATPFFQEDADHCMQSQNVCNSGDTVGEWPALAFVGGVPVLAYRDIHFAFAMNDVDNSDVELSWGGQRSSIDATWGGGTYSHMVVGPDQRVHVAHWNRFSGINFRVRGQGIFVISGTNGNWTRTKVSEEVDIGYKLAFAGGGARLGVAYNAQMEQTLKFVESPDGDLWGSPEVVDQSGNTGRAPALAYDLAGAPAVAYHFCGPYDPGSRDCPQDKDALRFASKASGVWKRMDVQASSGGVEGAFVALAFANDGAPVILFQANYFDPISMTTSRQLKVARGKR